MKGWRGLLGLTVYLGSFCSAAHADRLPKPLIPQSDRCLYVQFYSACHYSYPYGGWANGVCTAIYPENIWPVGTSRVGPPDDPCRADDRQGDEYRCTVGSQQSVVIRCCPPMPQEKPAPGRNPGGLGSPDDLDRDYPFRD